MCTARGRPRNSFSPLPKAVSPRVRLGHSGKILSKKTSPGFIIKIWKKYSLTVERAHYAGRRLPEAAEGGFAEDGFVSGFVAAEDAAEGFEELVLELDELLEGEAVGGGGDAA